MSHKVRMCSLTLCGGSESDPTGRRVTLFSDGGLKALPSRVAIDFGGDPASWTFVTSDHLMNVASNDADGFRIVKGTFSMARLRASAHAWKQAHTLEEWLTLDHPLTETLRGVTIETVRAFYADLRKKADTKVEVA